MEPNQNTTDNDPPVTAPTPITPQEKLARVSLLRLALEKVQAEITLYGDGLFLCIYHNQVIEVTPIDGKLNRPTCPDCGRPMKHVASEMA